MKAPGEAKNRMNSSESFQERLNRDIQNMDVVSDMMAEYLRSKQPWEKLEIASILFRFTRNMLEFHIRRTHPDWKEKKIQKEVSARILSGNVSIP